MGMLKKNKNKGHRLLCVISGKTGDPCTQKLVFAAYIEDPRQRKRLVDVRQMTKNVDHFLSTVRLRQGSQRIPIRQSEQRAARTIKTKIATGNYGEKSREY